MHAQNPRSGNPLILKNVSFPLGVLVKFGAICVAAAAIKILKMQF